MQYKNVGPLLKKSFPFSFAVSVSSCHSDSCELWLSLGYEGAQMIHADSIRCPEPYSAASCTEYANLTWLSPAQAPQGAKDRSGRWAGLRGAAWVKLRILGEEGAGSWEPAPGKGEPRLQSPGTYAFVPLDFA